MAYRVVICAVGIYFMEDALNFLKKYTCGLHAACLRHFNTKHKSAIVRKVGSFVTWIHAPRLHVALREEFKDISTSDDSCTLKCNCLSIRVKCQSCTNFEYGTECSVYIRANARPNIQTNIREAPTLFTNITHHLIGQRCETSSEEPKSSVHLENRIEELEKELLRLQAQVSNILLKTDSKDIKFYSDIDENVVSSTSAIQPSLPPPPPPLPPPLPPTPLVQTRTLLVKVKPKSAKVVEKDSTSTIMEELSKRPPKLRHVARSPGGRPIRSVPAPSDPSDILAAVLRKRFEAIHGEKQECYMLSPENSMKTTMITGH